MTDVLLKRGKFGLRHIHRGEGHVKMEAEIGFMPPQAKEHPGPPETKRQGEILPYNLQREHDPTNTLMVDF